MLKKNKLIFNIFIFSIIFSPLKAEWKELATLENGTKIYGDFETIKKGTKFSFMWLMHDFKKPMEGPLTEEINSAKVYVKVNCEEFKATYPQYIFYTGSMGSGESTLFQKKEVDWVFYPPGSWMKILKDNLCKK